MAAEVKKKLARKQVDTPVTGQEEKHDLGTWNIWTGRPAKGMGGGRDRGERRSKEASKYRCRPALDEGWTRGEGQGNVYCCLYFARGLCHHGSDCNFKHRVPSERDEVRHRNDYGSDIFGRERNPESRDGRKRGAGSYERECTTLYCNYGGAASLPAAKIRALVEHDFKEWGPIDDIYIAEAKALAFVRYRWRSSAEFAKAAMHQQTLSGSSAAEVLDVRWANDDPNPRAIVRVHHEREQAMRDAYLKAVTELPPEAKRARLLELHLLATNRPGAASSSYPNTDAQYGGGDPAAAGAAEAGVSAEDAAAGAYPDTDAQYGDASGAYPSTDAQYAGGALPTAEYSGWYAGGYQHEYQGWDQYQYQAAEQQQQGGGGEGGDGARTPPDPEGGASGLEVVGDDINRYLPRGARFEDAPPGSAAAQQQQQQQQQQQAEEGRGDEAQEVLGLLGGYGSSDEDGA